MDPPPYLQTLAEPKFGRAKRIRVWINGDYQSACNELYINPNMLRTWNSILVYLTQTLSPRFGAVRKLMCLRTRKCVACFSDLEPNEKYIAIGTYGHFKFIKNGYQSPSETNLRKKNIEKKLYSGEVFPPQIEFLTETKKRGLTIIFVTVNARSCQNAAKVVLSEKDMVTWDATLKYIAKILDVPDGIQCLCTIFGTTILEPKELQHGYVYVALPFNERFFTMDYMKLLYHQGRPRFSYTLKIKPSKSMNNNTCARYRKKKKKAGISNERSIPDILEENEILNNTENEDLEVRTNKESDAGKQKARRRSASSDEGKLDILEESKLSNNTENEEHKNRRSRASDIGKQKARKRSASTDEGKLDILEESKLLNNTENGEHTNRRSRVSDIEEKQCGLSYSEIKNINGNNATDKKKISEKVATLDEIGSDIDKDSLDESNPDSPKKRSITVKKIECNETLNILGQNEKNSYIINDNVIVIGSKQYFLAEKICNECSQTEPTFDRSETKNPEQSLTSALPNSRQDQTVQCSPCRADDGDPVHQADVSRSTSGQHMDSSKVDMGDKRSSNVPDALNPVDIQETAKLNVNDGRKATKSSRTTSLLAVADAASTVETMDMISTDSNINYDYMAEDESSQESDVVSDIKFETIAQPGVKTSSKRKRGIIRRRKEDPRRLNQRNIGESVGTCKEISEKMPGTKVPSRLRTDTKEAVEAKLIPKEVSKSHKTISFLSVTGAGTTEGPVDAISTESEINLGTFSHEDNTSNVSNDSLEINARLKEKTMNKIKSNSVRSSSTGKRTDASSRITQRMIRNVLDNKDEKITESREMNKAFSQLSEDKSKKGISAVLSETILSSQLKRFPSIHIRNRTDINLWDCSTCRKRSTFHCCKSKGYRRRSSSNTETCSASESERKDKEVSGCCFCHGSEKTSKNGKPPWPSKKHEENKEETRNNSINNETKKREKLDNSLVESNDIAKKNTALVNEMVVNESAEKVTEETDSKISEKSQPVDERSVKISIQDEAIHINGKDWSYKVVNNGNILRQSGTTEADSRITKNRSSDYSNYVGCSHISVTKDVILDNGDQDITSENVKTETNEDGANSFSSDSIEDK